MTSFPIQRAVLAASVAWVIGCSAGCGGPQKVEYARPFPASKTQSQAVNIQVTRQETQITLTNTSARDFPASTIWINQQWSRPVEAFSIGETLVLPLSSFRNEFSEKFRAGGFFATERPDKIVKVQIELEGELIGLLMVGEQTLR